MDYQDQEDGDGDAREMGRQRNVRRRKNVPIIPDQTSAVKNSFESRSLDQTIDNSRKQEWGEGKNDDGTVDSIESSMGLGAPPETARSNGERNEDGTMDLIQNLIGWPKCGSYDGEGNVEDGTVDLISLPPKSNRHEENDYRNVVREILRRRLQAAGSNCLSGASSSTRAPPGTLYPCTVCNTTWLLSPESLAEHRRSCLRRPVKVVRNPNLNRN